MAGDVPNPTNVDSLGGVRHNNSRDYIDSIQWKRQVEAGDNMPAKLQ